MTHCTPPVPAPSSPTAPEQPQARVARLWLRIWDDQANSTTYTCCPVTVPDALAAVRLNKCLDGKPTADIYIVSIDPATGARCEYHGPNLRLHNHSKNGCKHLDAVKACGLLPVPQVLDLARLSAEAAARADEAERTVNALRAAYDDMQEQRLKDRLAPVIGHQAEADAMAAALADWRKARRRAQAAERRARLAAHRRMQRDQAAEPEDRQLQWEHETQQLAVTA